MPDFIPWLVAGFDVFTQLARLLLDYLKVLAWPVVVLTLVLVYKRTIMGVLARLRKGKGPGFEIELFSDELADAAKVAAATDAAKEAAQTNTALNETAQAITGRDDGTPTIDATPPSDASSLVASLLDPTERPYRFEWEHVRRKRENLAEVNDAWLALLHAAELAGEELGKEPGQRTLSRVTLELIRRKVLRPDYATILSGLQALRRQIAAADGPPIEDVIDNFNSTARIITEQFERAHRRLAIERALKDSRGANAEDDD